MFRHNFYRRANCAQVTTTEKSTPKDSCKNQTPQTSSVYIQQRVNQASDKAEQDRLANLHQYRRLLRQVACQTLCAKQEVVIPFCCVVVF